MQRLTETVKLIDAITVDAGAAGTDDALDGAIVDMQGYTALAVIVKTGSLVSGAVTTLKLQQDDDPAMGAAADLQGTSQAIADTAGNKMFFVDLQRPSKRYVRLVVTRATQNATLTALYLLYGGRHRPATQPAGVTGETWGSPPEGTA
jgi:hypothetical protein